MATAELEEVSIDDGPRPRPGRDDLVACAFAGDPRALHEAFALIAQQVAASSGLVEPPPLRRLYDEVEKGIADCARPHFHRSRLCVAGPGLRERFLIVVSGAVAEWFLVDHRTRPPWNPSDGHSLAQYVEAHAQVPVARVIARMTTELEGK